MTASGWQFEAIYPKYEGLVRATLSRYGVRPADLDDVTQETFVAIHRKLVEFEDRSSIETWLHSICWRVAVAYRRRAHIQRETALIGEALCDRLPPDNPQILADRLHAVLDGLTEEQRDLLALHEIGGLSISELAALTAVTRETVRERLRRARIALRRGIERDPRGGVVAIPFPEPVAKPVAPDGAFDYVDESCCLAGRGALTFVLWRRSPDVRRLRIVQSMMAKSRACAPGQLLHFCVIEGTSTPPDHAARKVNAEIVALVRSDLRAVAFVVERKSLASLVPAVLNTAVFFARSPIQIRYVKDVAGGAAFLAPFRERLTAESLIAQVAWMRARLDAYAAAAPAGS